MISSTLRNICKEIIDCIEPLEGEYDSIIEDELIKGKQKIDKIINELKHCDNLLLHHPKRGGLLRGDIRSRKNEREHWDNQNNFIELCCIEEKLKSEEGFHRALFNLKSYNYTNFKTKKIQKLDLLSYQSPLIRKKNKLNPKIGRLFARCDLVGVGEKYLATIEIKVVPYGENTRLPFALLESLFYGYILQQHAEGQNRLDLQQEANFCKREYGREKIKLDKNFDVYHFIGAPQNYFKGYIIDKNEKLTKYFNTKKWLSQAASIENATKKLKDIFPKFGGYFLFYQSEIDVVDKGRFRLPVPGFIRWDEPVLHFNSIEEILKACKEHLI